MRILFQVIETIGKENVQLNQKQLNEIIDLIDKEEIIETEEKIEKALKKEQEQKVMAAEKSEGFTESEKAFTLKDSAQEVGKKNESGSKNV